MLIYFSECLYVCYLQNLRYQLTNPSGRSSAQPKIKKWTDWRSLQEQDFYTVSLLTLNCLYFTNTERKKLGNAFNEKNAWKCTYMPSLFSFCIQFLSLNDTFLNFSNFKMSRPNFPPPIFFFPRHFKNPWNVLKFLIMSFLGVIGLINVNIIYLKRINLYNYHAAEPFKAELLIA